MFIFGWAAYVWLVWFCDGVGDWTAVLSNVEVMKVKSVCDWFGIINGEGSSFLRFRNIKWNCPV